MPPVDSRWHSILEIARHAPSPHNTQPWMLKVIDDRHAELYLVRSRLLPDEDTTGCFLICAMGIFIESLRIVAGNANLRLESVSRTDFDVKDRAGPELTPFALLSLHDDGNCQTRFSNELFLKRRTSRLHPDPRALSSDSINEAQDTAAAHGQKLLHTNDRARIEVILHRNIDAVFHDLNQPHYHDEIMRWFRFGKRHEQRTRDGLSSRCLGVTAAELYCSGTFPGLMTNPVTRKLMFALYDWRLGTAFDMGFLSGRFFDRQSAEHAGRALLQMWLVLTRHDVSIHPFGNLVTNPDAHRWLSDFMGVNDIWLVFRCGHTKPPPQSLRRSTEELLLD